MNIEFDCAHCSRRLTVDASAAGSNTQCPLCGKPVVVPSASPQTLNQKPGTDMIFCPKCGQQNLENNFKCTKCGFVLHGPAQPQYVISDDSTMGGLIPYKNALALWAYYLGILSLLPIIGIPLGVAALILGIKGLRYADLHPDARGKNHAWAGVIFAGLCAVGNMLVIRFMFMFY